MGRLRLRRAVDPRVRLEVLDSCGVRTAFYFLYGSVAAAITLVVILKLGLTSSSIDLDGVALCTNASRTPVHDSGSIASSACCYPSPTPNSPNTTVWTGSVTGLSALDGDVKITAFPRQPASLPLSLSFYYDAELQGRGLGGQESLVLSIANATASIQCAAAPSGSATPWVCGALVLLDTSVLSNGLGAGGFTAYTATITFQSEQ